MLVIYSARTSRIRRGRVSCCHVPEKIRLFNWLDPVGSTLPGFLEFLFFFFFFSALVEKPVLWHTPWKHSGSLTLRIGKIQLFLFCFLRGVTIWDWENADPLKEWESWLVAPGLRPGLVWRRFVLLIISVGTFHLWGGRGVKTCILIHNQSVSTEKHSSIYQC